MDNGGNLDGSQSVEVILLFEKVALLLDRKDYLGARTLLSDEYFLEIWEALMWQALLSGHHEAFKEIFKEVKKRSGLPVAVLRDKVSRQMHQLQIIFQKKLPEIVEAGQYEQESQKYFKILNTANSQLNGHCGSGMLNPNVLYPPSLIEGKL